MKVLVAGGAGYIGSHAVYELIRAGHEVVIVDNLTTGDMNMVHPEASFYECDIRDYDKLVDILKKEATIDVAMHFAAKLIVPESVTQPLEYYSNNVEGVRIMIEALRDTGIKNIVFSSTAATYGEPENPVCQEDDIKLPINPYGESKLAAERLIHWCCNAYDMNYCIFRYFNVAGADESGKIGLKKDTITHLIPVAIQAALGIRDKMTIFGTDYNTPDGTCIRDYIHVTDLAQAHILGAKYIFENNTSGTFNLGSSEGFSVKEVVEAVNKIKEVPHDFGERRLGDPAKLIASNTRAKEVLGWEPKLSLEVMIESDMAFRMK